MLSTLLIKNIALIEQANIEFGPGLNVLSGETGAGKSVILDSINFVLGAKADKSMIRYGESECSVTADFVVEDDATVLQVLREMDIDAEKEIIITRKFRLDGRGDIRINGEIVNATNLRKITACLVDVHGQSEHFYLLNEVNQLKVIDKIVGIDADKLKQELGNLLDENKNLQNRLKELGTDEGERNRRLDIIRFQIDEIDEASIKIGEDDALKARKLLFTNLEKVRNSLSEACAYLSGDNAAIDCLRGAKRAIGELSNIDKEYSDFEDRMESITIEAEDIGESLSSILDNLFFDEQEINEIERRLDIIHSLKKKYGGSIESVLIFRDNIQKEYDLLSDCDEQFENISAQMKKNLSKIYSICRKLSELRKKAAYTFCDQVSKELKSLNIKNAQFNAEFQAFEEKDVLHASGNGLDSMQFLFSANTGEPMKPLSKVISGGEMSRLMLAIKTKISDPSGISTYIFDEIDTGISGNTAKTVSKKFNDISKSKQIIAVSHLAQIVAMADDNFLIEKNENEQGKTLTHIRHIAGDDAESEIVRLLGGNVESMAARSMAQELINECTEYKKLTKAI